MKRTANRHDDESYESERSKKMAPEVSESSDVMEHVSVDVWGCVLHHCGPLEYMMLTSVCQASHVCRFTVFNPILHHEPEDWPFFMCAEAARRGNLKLLIWLRLLGHEWNEETIINAITYDHLECFLFAMENGAPVAECATERAVICSPDCLSWLLGRDPHHLNDVGALFTDVIDTHSIRSLELLWEFYRIDELSGGRGWTDCAIIEGNEPALGFLIRKGFPWCPKECIERLAECVGAENSTYRVGEYERIYNGKSPPHRYLVTIRKIEKNPASFRDEVLKLLNIYMKKKTQINRPT